MALRNPQRMYAPLSDDRAIETIILSTYRNPTDALPYLLSKIPDNVKSKLLNDLVEQLLENDDVETFASVVDLENPPQSLKDKMIKEAITKNSVNIVRFLLENGDYDLEILLSLASKSVDENRGHPE